MKRGLWILFWVLVAVMTIWGTYKAIFFGNDIDESYAITQSYRLVLGDRLFKDMWEVHQTSAVFMAPFIYIYRILAGNTIGIVVFLRAVGCFCSLLTAALFFVALRGYTDKRVALMLSLIVYNYTPKYIQVPEFCLLGFLFTICLVSCLLLYLKRDKLFWMVMAGISMAGCVLAYPLAAVAAVVIFVLAYLILREKADGAKALKAVVAMAATDVILGAAFLAIIFSALSLSDFTRNIQYILMDGAHQIPMYVKAYRGLIEAVDLQRYPLIGMVIVEIVSFVMRKKGKGEATSRLKTPFLLLCMAGGVLFMIQTRGKEGIRFVDLSYWMYSILPGLFYVNYRMPYLSGKKEASKEGSFSGKMHFLLLWIPLSVFIAAYFQSNLSLYANGGLILPALLLQLVMFYSQRSDSLPSRGYMIYILLLFLTIRCICIRFTSVQPRTIFDPMFDTAVGPLKGVYQTNSEHIMYHSKLDMIQQHVTVDDTLLYMGSDTYLYFFVGNQVGISSTISTPTFDEALVAYYELYPEKMPTVIALDKYYTSLEQLEENETFYKWLSENYDIENPDESYFVDMIYPRR